MFKLVLLVAMCCVTCDKITAQPKRNDCIEAINQGNALLWRFRPSDALRQYYIGMKLAKEIHNDSLYATGMFGAGQAIWYAGNFPGAVDTIKLALTLFKENNDLYNTTAALRILSNIYDDQGDYENAFKAVRDALELFKNFKDDQNNVLSLIQMGALYKSIGDYDLAMEFYSKARAEKPNIGEYPYRELNHRIGELYVARNMPDSARYFYRNALKGNPNSKTIKLRIGELYLLQNKADSAFTYLYPLYKEASITTDVNIMIATMLGLGKIYFDKGNLPVALIMVQDALEMSTQRGLRQYSRDACLLLSHIYEAKEDAAKALNYLKQYESVKDSIVSNQFKGQLYSFKQKVEESKQVAAIQSLKDGKRLAQRTILIICLSGVLVFSIITMRHKNEKLKFKQTTAELEMKALRAQMNPHFIFNCLSAINHFILNKEADKASDYLVQFSRLIRMVLNNAGKPVISMEEELNMLKLYLNMEQLRFKDAFDYYIYFDPAVQPSIINIPSFILQPFCENAIWHGLLHKEAKGQLNIHFKMEEDYLICTIRDNGIGRIKAAKIKLQFAERQHALGQKLTAQRLALFNRESNSDNSFSVLDIKDESGDTAGTQVILKIKMKDA